MQADIEKYIPKTLENVQADMYDRYIIFITTGRNVNNQCSLLCHCVSPQRKRLSSNSRKTADKMI